MATRECIRWFKLCQDLVGLDLPDRICIGSPSLVRMDIDRVLEAIAQRLPSRQLSPLEQLIVRQSWLGKTYSEMAQGTGYGSDYLKEVGSQLWQDLSEALGERVTKKNLHLVLSKPEQEIQEKSKDDQPNFGADLTSIPQLLSLGTATHSEVNLASNVELKLEFPSGPVPLASPLYINRSPIEEQIFAEIKRPGSVTRIKAPRKMGKTSLLNRVIAYAKTCDYQTVYLNFQEADEAVFKSLDKLLRWFSANVSRQLSLELKLDEYWDEDIGSKISCKAYFEEYLLQTIQGPLLLALDEINRIFEHPAIAQDFLPMLRAWHEQAKQVEVWQKLRLVVAYATEIYVPLKLNQSPFNVGLSVTLPSLTLPQVQDLARRWGLDWATHELEAQRLAPLVSMIGGHPHLINIALYHLCQGKITIEELLQTAPTQTGIYSPQLRSYLAILQNDAQLASAMRLVVTAAESTPLDAITTYKLENLGLIELEDNRAKPSCEVYRLYFREQLPCYQSNEEITT